MLCIFVTLLCLEQPLVIFGQKSGISNHAFGTIHSFEQLIDWANKEDEIYHALKNKLGMIDKEIELITNYIGDCEVSLEEYGRKPISDHGGRLIGSSAILSHMMISRYATIVNDFRALLGSNDYLAVSDEANKLLATNCKNYFGECIDWDDLHISHISILRIQEYYDIRPKQIYNDFESNMRLCDCVSLGVFALQLGFNYLAIEWLELAVELNDGLEPNDLIKNLLSIAIQEHNGIVLHSIISHEPHRLHTYVDPVLPFQSFEERKTGKMHLSENYPGVYGVQNDYNLHLLRNTRYRNELLLCSGIQFQPEIIQSRMKCYLKKDGHHYFLLNPLKSEQLSADPYIVQYYDVLGNDIIQEFYKARRESTQSTIRSLLDSRKSRESSESRLAAGNFANWDYEGRVRKKFEMLTGMLANLRNGSEPIQFTEYIYGRFYQPHRDLIYPNTGINDAYGSSDLILDGNRIATLLYYVDAPESGGFTAYINAGVAAKPIKGSAVLWYNMFRNGTMREDVFHSACPVIQGRKLIMNQWFRYNDNFQRVKCSLNQFE